MTQYGPTGTVSTSYPLIYARIHVAPGFVYLNETTMKVDGLSVNYTASYAGMLPAGANWITDVELTYQVQAWMATGLHNASVSTTVLEFDGSSSARATLALISWPFTIIHDPMTEAVLGLNSSVTQLNKTLTLALGQLRSAATFGTTLNNTARYLNATVGDLASTVGQLNNEINSSSGSLYWLQSFGTNWTNFVYEVLGVLVLFLAVAIAALAVALSTRGKVGNLVDSIALNSSRSGVTVTDRTDSRGAKGVICPNCGAHNRELAKFCTQCNTFLGGPSPASTDPTGPAQAGPGP